MPWDEALLWIAVATALLWIALLVLLRLPWASRQDEYYAEQIVLVAWAVTMIVVVIAALVE